MDEWNTVLATNLTAPFILCKKVITIMEKQGAGTIVNVASMAATAAGRGGLAYTSAKHGLLGLTRQMSLDHGRTGVRINAVLPGPIATDMIARVLAIPQHPVTMKTVSYTHLDVYKRQVLSTGPCTWRTGSTHLTNQ